MRIDKIINRRLISVVILGVAFFSACACHADCARDSERISPLTVYPTSCPQDGFYQTVEWADFGQVGAPLPGRQYISANGYQLTSGVVYRNARIEYTGFIYDISGAPAGALKRSKITEDMYQGSYALMLNRQWGGYTGEVLVGIRWFENEVGELTEYYVTREFTKDNLSFIAGVNVINKSTGYHTRAGGTINVRYRIAPHTSLFGQYNSADYFKSFVNDFIVPYVYETPKSQLGCDACAQDSFSGGIIFNHGKGSGYLILNQMEQKFEPLAGATLRF
jgi:hypothetical protein